MEEVLTSLWNMNRVKMGADLSYWEVIVTTIIVIKTIEAIKAQTEKV